MLHSFRGIHKGCVFTIYFKVYPKCLTARLEIDGLPPLDYADDIWNDQDQAKADISNDARRIIDGMRS